MKYRGYEVKLCGVYKMEHGQKRYALEIYKDTAQVYKSDWIYAGEKQALKDAKLMIRKNSFDAEVIRKRNQSKHAKKEIDWDKMKRNSDRFLTISLVLLLLLYVACLADFRGVGTEYVVFPILYGIFGMLMSGIMLFWGVFAKGKYEFNKKQRKLYKLIWISNLFLNRGPYIPYNDQPFEEKEKGWYSASPLISLLFESLFALFTLGLCVVQSRYAVLFWSTVLSYLLLICNYVSSLLWEMSDAKTRGKEFPFRRIVTPILTVLVLVLVAVIYIKIVGVKY